MNNLKVEGKVGDFCLKCKNCKAVTRIHDGKNASIRIIEVDCEDPYDGMVKTLDVDSNICCSMFEPKSDRSCENDIYVTSYMGLYEEKKEKEPCDKISLLQHELEMERLRTKIHQLEKEKAAHLKGIERLKKSQEKLQNQVKNLKVYADENGQMYKELQEWREKCISRGNDIDHLLSENKEKDKKIGELESHKEECEKKYRDEISKLQNIVTEKEVEIKGLKKDNARLSKDISWGNMIAEKNTELNQTISDQEVTIKALLITIKEMCKEDETNE